MPVYFDYKKSKLEGVKNNLLFVWRHYASKSCSVFFLSFLFRPTILHFTLFTTFSLIPRLMIYDFLQFVTPYLNSFGKCYGYLKISQFIQTTGVACKSTISKFCYRYASLNKKLAFMKIAINQYEISSTILLIMNVYYLSVSIFQYFTT